MPQYMWKCDKCEAEYMRDVPMAEMDNPPPTITEPHCEHKWRRVITAVAHILQGKGWYRDGY